MGDGSAIILTSHCHVTWVEVVHWIHHSGLVGFISSEEGVKRVIERAALAGPKGWEGVGGELP